jgi:type VI secretion system protein ImpC
MIELDVATRRKPVATIDDPPSNYLVLGDFGGCLAGPIAVDHHNFDEALGRMEVRIGTMRFHKLDDFHPDHLCQRVPLFRDSIPTASASPEQSPELSPDAALGERMRGVLHHPPFQAIEAAWRGIHFLVHHGYENHGADSGAYDGARVFLAQYSRDDLDRDLLNLAMGPASHGDDTRIEELLNARRWRAIAGLYSFGPDACDIELLRRVASLAAQVRAPFISACSLPEGSADMGPYWSELTAIPEADYIGLVLPRFLLRLPYGARTAPIDSFAFEEMPGVPVPSRYLWGNPALACLSLLARGGGALDLTGLPLHSHEKEGKVTTTACVEMRITEVRELALIDAGLMPLVPSAKYDCARLAGFRAINGKELPVA